MVETAIWGNFYLWIGKQEDRQSRWPTATDTTGRSWQDNMQTDRLPCKPDSLRITNRSMNSYGSRPDCQKDRHINYQTDRETNGQHKWSHWKTDRQDRQDDEQTLVCRIVMSKMGRRDCTLWGKGKRQTDQYTDRLDHRLTNKRQDRETDRKDVR
jgi:hypothetical protein